MKNQPIWNRNFLSTWVSTFCLFMVFYSLIASLPIYVTDTLNSGSGESGLVVTVFLIAAVLFRPLAGNWLDKFGKKKILLIALCMFLVSSSLYFFVQNLTQLLLLRFIHGISFGIASTATGALVADIIPENRKGEGIGYYALSYNMAMFLGPFLGLIILSHYNFSVLFILLLSISCLSLLVATSIGIKQMPTKHKNYQEKVNFWSTIFETNAIPVAIVVMLLSFAFSGFLTFIPIYASELDISSMAGYFYVIYAIMMVLSRPITGKIFDRYNEHMVIYPSILLYTLGLVCLSLAQSPFLFLIAAGVIGVGFGALSPSLQSIAVKSTTIKRSGIATATFLTFFDIGVSLGSLVLGLIVSETNFKFMYFGSSIIVSFSALLYYILYHRKKIRMNTGKNVNLHS